jgi:hypothetical protein
MGETIAQRDAAAGQTATQTARASQSSPSARSHHEALLNDAPRAQSLRESAETLNHGVGARATNRLAELVANRPQPAAPMQRRVDPATAQDAEVYVIATGDPGYVRGRHIAAGQHVGFQVQVRVRVDNDRGIETFTFDQLDPADPALRQAEVARRQAEAEVALLTPILGGLNTAAMMVEARKCLAAGFSTADITGFIGVAGNDGAKLRPLLFMKHTNRTATGGVALADAVAAKGLLSTGGARALVAACGAVRAAALSEANAVVFVNAYLNADRAAAVSTAFDDLRAIGTAQVTALFGLRAQWPGLWLHVAAMIDAVKTSPDKAKALALLTLRQCIWATVQPRLQVLAIAPAVDVARIDWACSAQLAGGNSTANCAAAATYLEAHHATPEETLGVQLLLSFTAATATLDQLRPWVAGGANPSEVKQRFVTVRAHQGNLANAQAALAAAPLGANAVTALLQASNVPNIHIRDSEHAAKALSKSRPNVAANSCIETGLAGMSAELLRVMTYYRGVIAAVANNGRSDPLTLPTAGGEFVWVSRDGRAADREAWRTTDVVIGKQANGTLYVAHCQPNP